MLSKLDAVNNNLVLAVQYGQELLSKNNQLQEQLDAIATEYQETLLLVQTQQTTINQLEECVHNLESKQTGSQQEETVSNLTLSIIDAHPNNEILRRDASNAAVIESLEKTVAHLNNQVDTLNQELIKSQELSRIQDKYTKKLEGDLESLKNEAEILETKVTTLDSEKKNLVKEKMELSRSLKNEKESNSSKQQVLAQRLQELEQMCSDFKVENERLKEFELYAKSDTTELEARCIELEEMLEEYRTYREEYEKQSNQIEEMGLDIECLRQHCETLKARLAVLEPDQQNGGVDTGGKSLLGEVEDRRQEVEGQYKNLTDKHSSLMEKHSIIMQDRQRMKSHISRLRQLTVRSLSSDADSQDLQNALNQSEAEKKQLMESLKRLQSQLAETGIPVLQTSEKGSKDEVIDCLRFKLTQLSDECSRLRKEANSALMLKQNESLKLRNLQQSLKEKTGEVQKANAMIAQLKYELEESKSASVIPEAPAVEDVSKKTESKSTVSIPTRTTTTTTKQSAPISQPSLADLKPIQRDSRPTESTTTHHTTEIPVSTTKVDSVISSAKVEPVKTSQPSVLPTLSNQDTKIVSIDRKAAATSVNECNQQAKTSLFLIPFSASMESWREDHDFSVDAIPEEQELDKVEPESLYAILNCSQDASDEDIKNAYRKLCIIFHPDKHTSAEDRAAAQSKFQTIQRAFDILGHPTKRYIYDLYGEEGLEQSWEIGNRFKTKEEIREEYERKTKQRQDAEVDSLIRSKGEVIVTVDASSVFGKDRWKGVRPGAVGLIDPFNAVSGGDEKPESSVTKFIHKLQQIRFKQAAVKHSWETKLTANTDLVVTGLVNADQGSGEGNITSALRYVHTPLLWGELSGTFGSDAKVEGRIVKNFTTDTQTSFVAVTGTMRTLYIPPSLTVVFGRRISQKITGYLNFNSGEFPIFSWGENLYRPSSSTSIGIVRKSGNSSINLNLHAGILSSGASVTYSKGCEWLGDVGKSVRLRCSVNVATSSMNMISMGFDKKVGNYGRFGYGVDFTMGGVIFRFKILRQGQKLSIPVIMSLERDAALAVGATVVPFGLYIALDRFLFAPRRKQLKAKKLEDLKRENEEVLALRKKEAQEASSLMKESVNRKIESEVKKNGLIIVSALYGKLPPSRLTPNKNGFSMQSFRNLFGSEANVINMNDIDVAHLRSEGNLSEQQYIDVTVVVQNLVNQSQLHISGGHSKSNLLGFYDPCFGEAKKLRIIYQFQERIHEVEVGDFEAVAAPLRAHIV